MNMETIKSVSDEELEGRVLDYIKSHPDTEETMESVSDWWLRLQSLDPSIDRITAVLEDLVDKELIVKVDFGQDIFIYNIR